MEAKKVLKLIIKQKYFDEILSGEKKQEIREIKPTTEKKLVLLDDDGYAVEDENGNSIPVKYDAIQFYVGYNKDRDSALIEVESAYTEIIVDEDGEPISYDYEGEPYFVEQVIYNLGKVLEKNVKEKK